MESQKELFEEFKDRGVVKKRFFTKTLLAEKTLTFVVAYDKLILAILGSLIVLALVFVFGFERGKRGRVTRISAQRVSLPPIPQAAIERPTRAIEPKKTTQGLAQRPYTIQVATFKSKEWAKKESDQLKKKGFPITIIGINGLYEVLAGEYSDVKEAGQALSALKKNYKDCYIRKR